MNEVLNETLLERKRVRTAFDRAAARYDSAAGLQRRAAERLLTHVQASGVQPETILDAGCGTGYGARLLASVWPEAALYCLDLAPAMVLQARSECGTGPAYVCADAEHLPMRESSIDLLWSNAMLQWCNDLDTVFGNFARVMRPGALLAFTTFGPATLGELRAAFDDGYTHVSRFPGAAQIEDALLRAGFRDIALESRKTVLHYPDVPALMRSIKTIGAGNATAGRARGLTGKGRWQAMIARYERLRTERGLPATYELLYGTARGMKA
ncbi:MAG: malonyl-ACP O-methyltransferase BioC [Pseudomonadota bacterium]|nr:MAG: malonyl-[acyl-carrier protein] O-methyltransferase BioC [Pseudomonadota bacterium]